MRTCKMLIVACLVVSCAAANTDVELKSGADDFDKRIEIRLQEVQDRFDSMTSMIQCKLQTLHDRINTTGKSNKDSLVQLQIRAERLAVKTERKKDRSPNIKWWGMAWLALRVINTLLGFL